MKEYRHCSVCGNRYEADFDRDFLIRLTEFVCRIPLETCDECPFLSVECNYEDGSRCFIIKSINKVLEANK